MRAVLGLFVISVIVCAASVFAARSDELGRYVFEQRRRSGLGSRTDEETYVRLNRWTFSAIAICSGFAAVASLVKLIGG